MDVHGTTSIGPYQIKGRIGSGGMANVILGVHETTGQQAAVKVLAGEYSNDVDFKRRKIKIRRKEFWQPKTGEREIPINQALLELLTKLKEKNDQGLQSNFVFPHSDGSRICIKLREKLIQIAQKAEIEDLTKLHTLRHTFASHLVMSGVDLPTVMKLMGHSDIQTTMIYAHLAPDHLAEAVNRLEFG